MKLNETLEAFNIDIKRLILVSEVKKNSRKKLCYREKNKNADQIIVETFIIVSTEIKHEHKKEVKIKAIQPVYKI